MHLRRIFLHVAVLLMLVVATSFGVLVATEGAVGVWIQPDIRSGEDGSALVTLAALIVALPAVAASYAVALLVTRRHRDVDRRPWKAHAGVLALIVLLVVAVARALTGWDEFDVTLRHLVLIVPPVLVSYTAAATLTATA